MTAPGESRSRVAIARAGLPAPVLQWEVRSASGRFVGFVDFGWPALRTVGEFDGLIKYGRLLRLGQTAGDAVVEEKLREDELRATGLAVVRWGAVRWSEPRRPSGALGQGWPGRIVFTCWNGSWRSVPSECDPTGSSR